MIVFWRLLMHYAWAINDISVRFVRWTQTRYYRTSQQADLGNLSAEEAIDLL